MLKYIIFLIILPIMSSMLLSVTKGGLKPLVIYLFRYDLRLMDNTALMKAAVATLSTQGYFVSNITILG